MLHRLDVNVKHVQGLGPFLSIAAYKGCREDLLMDLLDADTPAATALQSHSVAILQHDVEATALVVVTT